jgi:Predicted pyridoxal phosphate-dependent enzyme apparently involved in regulation of cell wall biogenesis
MNLLKEDGVPSALYYPAALHLQKPYFSDIRLKITEEIAKRVISLPMHPYLEDEEVEYITDSFLNALKHSAL